MQAVKPSYADPGIFVRGGPGQSDKKSSDVFLFFFSPQLFFTEVKWLISKETIIFQSSRGGPTFSRGGGGGVQLFPGGGEGGPIAYSL